eukprot:SAG11_NODE_80_length_17731_cov_13.985254_18_plen_181_part_00
MPLDNGDFFVTRHGGLAHTGAASHVVFHLVVAELTAARIEALGTSVEAVVRLCGRCGVRSLLLPTSITAAGGAGWMRNGSTSEAMLDDPGWIISAVRRAIGDRGQGEAAGGGGGGGGGGAAQPPLSMMPREITFASGAAGYRGPSQALDTLYSWVLIWVVETRDVAARLMATEVFADCKL